MNSDKLKIVGHTEGSSAGKWLRLEQHFKILNRQGKANCSFVEPDMDPEVAQYLILSADVLVTASGSEKSVLSYMETLAEGGKAYLYDVDDLPDRVSPFNQAYRSYGLSNVLLDPEYENGLPEELKQRSRDESGKLWLWKDGIDGFDLEKNRSNMASYFHFLGKCSALSTTQWFLAERLGPINDRIYFRPNVADFTTVWRWKAKPRRDGKVRVMFMGGASHLQDFQHVAPALIEISKMYPHVVFQFFGNTECFAKRILPEDRIESQEWEGDYGMFAWRLAHLAPDIGIAPLNMGKAFAEFNRSKSCLKWLDYACVGVPSVCQWDTPYQEAVRFGKDVPEDQWTGLLASSTEDWISSLAMLIEHPEAREVIGQNAYQEARANWDAEVWADEFLSHYEEIANGNHHAQDAA